MKLRNKLFGITLALTLMLSLLSLVCSASSLDLINNNAGDDKWDLLEDTWSGVLTNTSGVVTSRVINEEGQLIITGCGDSANGTKDNWLGNYIGIGKYLKANSEYTVTVKIKFDAGLSDPLQTAYPNSYVDLWILYHDADFTTTMPSRDSLTITDTNGEGVEYTYTFTTGDESSLAAGYLQVGPHGAGQNHYWGGLCPTATIVIDSCVLEGDLVGVVEESPDQSGNENSGDNEEESESTGDEVSHDTADTLSLVILGTMVSLIGVAAVCNKKH